MVDWRYPGNLMVNKQLAFEIYLFEFLLQVLWFPSEIVDVLDVTLGLFPQILPRVLEGSLPGVLWVNPVRAPTEISLVITSGVSPEVSLKIVTDSFIVVFKGSVLGILFEVFL